MLIRMSFLTTPDDAHLDDDQPRCGFTLDYGGFLDLVEFNQYPIPNTNQPISLLAIRGCEALDIEDPPLNKNKIALTSVKPDFIKCKCLIGIIDSRSKKISAFGGSTLPSKGSVLRYAQSRNDGSSVHLSNYLPHGRYLYTRGTHYGASGPIPDILRQGYGPMPLQASQITVLRPMDLQTFGVNYSWDLCIPRDNIHPTGQGDQYSSDGCITIQGSYDGKHHGEWASFVKQLNIIAPFQKYFYLHLTSAREVGYILHHKNKRRIKWCIRHGSYGSHVARLHEVMNLKPKHYFDAVTKYELVNRQATDGKDANGVFISYK
jgi:hypothetical protein